MHRKKRREIRSLGADLLDDFRGIMAEVKLCEHKCASFWMTAVKSFENRVRCPHVPMPVNGAAKARNGAFVDCGTFTTKQSCMIERSDLRACKTLLLMRKRLAQ